MRIRILTVLLFVSSLASLMAQPASSADSSSQIQPDSVVQNQGSYQDKSTWEKIVSLPGDLVYLPAWLVLKPVNALVGAAYERKWVEQVEELTTWHEGQRGIRPVYSSRTGTGIKYFHKNFISSASKMDVAAAAGPQLRQNYYWRLRNLNLGAVSFSTLADYRLLPDEAYYGIGPLTRDDDDLTFIYRHERSQFLLSAGPTVKRNWAIRATAGLEINSILRGRNSGHNSLTCDIAEHKLGAAYGGYQTIHGNKAGLRLLKTGLETEFDNRRFIGSDVGGTRMYVSYSRYADQSDDLYNFSRIDYDLTVYVPLFYGRLLSLRTAGEFASPNSDSDKIPFYYLGEIGRKETVRGFQRGRFRDRQMALVSGEYIFPVRSRVRVARFQQVGDENDSEYVPEIAGSELKVHLFVDAGKVAREEIFSDFSQDLQITYGIGIRQFNLDGEVIGFEIGFSDDGYRLTFSLN